MMNTAMAISINNESKTETRRVLKKFYDISLKDPKKTPYFFEKTNKKLQFKVMQGIEKVCPIFQEEGENNFFCGDNFTYKVGEQIWIREPAFITNYIFRFDSAKIEYQLKSDKKKKYKIDLPARFFPNPKKWITEHKSVPNGCIAEMAKTFVTITKINVENLHDITFGDVLAEGIEIKNVNNLTKAKILDLSKKVVADDLTAIEIAIKNSFIQLWDSVANEGYRWIDDPFVVVYKFRKTKLVH